MYKTSLNKIFSIFKSHVKEIDLTTSVESAEKNYKIVTKLRESLLDIFNTYRNIETELDRVSALVDNQISALEVRISRLKGEEPVTKPVIEIAPGVNVVARIVGNVLESKKYRGCLCYCPKIDMFSICIDNYVYSGKIGNILDANKKPKFFREYIGGIKGSKTYYMSPLKYPESKHIRTWTNKMLYVNSAAELNEREQFAFRIGSRDELRSDLLNITSEDAALAADYFIHFLLVLVTMSQHKKI